MGTHGQLTAQMGARLESWLAPLGYEVLYDHGEGAKDNVGNIVAWFGEDAAPTHATSMSQLDIAVVKSINGKRHAVALIEIEESDDRPKNVLGDLFGALLADHVGYGGEQLAVDARTALILMARGPEAHQARMERLVGNVRQCRGLMLGRNSAIGHIAGELFSDEAEMETKLRKHVEEALGRFGQVA